MTGGVRPATYFRLNHKTGDLIMELLEYYARQSPITDPGEFGEMFADLPRDITELCQVAQSLIIHYMDGEKLFNCAIPKERLPEVDTRYVTRMLARIKELDDRPLTEARSPEKRLIGCCRDFATLFCAMTRYLEIPARVRIGFGAYYIPEFNQDHAIVECWDNNEKCWRLIDPEISDRHMAEYSITFNPHDVPRDQFILGGQAWQMCRSGQINADKFGVDPKSEFRGWSAIQHKLIQDLAAQNKIELLLWDVCGLMGRSPSEEELDLLDKVAVLTQAGNEAFSEMQAIYENEPSLKVPPVIMSYSPASAPSEVMLGI